ncbi:MAG: helix-turn-helix domain-containing protein [Spirochaetota bacterium]
MSEQTTRPTKLSEHDEDDLLTVAEVAGVLRVSTTTVIRELNARHIAEVRIARRRLVRVADLRVYIDTQRSAV